MTKIKNENRIFFLDVLKGIAILWVMYFHATRKATPLISDFWNELLDNGYFGNYLFFFVAGFNAHSGSKRLLDASGAAFVFLKKKFVRLYTPYFFSLFVSVLLVPCIYLHTQRFSEQVKTFTFVFYSVWDWFLQLTLLKVFTAKTWFLPEAFQAVDGVLWFVAVLIQMYVVVAAAMLAPRYFYRILGVLTVCGILAYVPQIKSLIPVGLFLPYWFHFAAGMAVAYLIQNGHQLRIDDRWSMPYAIAVAAIGIGVYLISMEFLVEERSWIFIGWVGLIVWLLSPVDNSLQKIRLFHLFAFVGMLSYSLYLLHTSFGFLARGVNSSTFNIKDDLFRLYFQVPAIIPFSYLWYLRFEKPGTPSACWEDWKRFLKIGKRV